MPKSDNKDSTASPQDQKGAVDEKTAFLEAVIKNLHAQIEIKDRQITVLSGSKSVNPDAFMCFDAFCIQLDVTEMEGRLLIASMKGDPGFLEMSQKNRRLYAKTGIEHLFKIREQVVGMVKKESRKRKSRK